MPKYIDMDSALQAHPEFLNEQIDDHDKAIYAKGWNACNSAFYGAIKELPTVSPDEVRGVGKWIERDDYDWDIYYECSVCHTPFTMLDGTTPELNDYHYCPNCGAKMEVSEDA